MKDDQSSGEWVRIQQRRIERVHTSKPIPTRLIKEALARPHGFEAWLKQHDADAVLGDLYTPDDSPLANFLWDTLGVYVWTADEIVYRVDDRVAFIPMPQWCMQFEVATDELAKARGGDDTDLRASELLTILKPILTHDQPP